MLNNIVKMTLIQEVRQIESFQHMYDFFEVS